MNSQGAWLEKPLDVLRKKDVRHYSPDLLVAFSEVMHKVNVVQNNREWFLGADTITKIPESIAPFYDKNCWKLLLSTWAVQYDYSGFDLIVEKFCGTSPYSSEASVWRVSGDDWSVVFVGSRDGYLGGGLDLPLESIKDPNREAEFGFYTPLLPRYISSGRQFSLTGDEQGLMRDAMQWKLSK